MRADRSSGASTDRSGLRWWSRRGWWRASVLPLAILPAISCDVEWGGARVALEDPSPPRPEPAATPAEEERRIPLPAGPLLYLARPSGPTGVWVTPLAQLSAGGGVPVDLAPPDTLTAEYRARFDSVFLRTGTELVLQSAGRRIGSVVLGEVRSHGDPRCPSVSGGNVLVVPGQAMRETMVALPAALSPIVPERAPALDPVRGMVLAAPVIAERLIGGDRAFLAQQVSLAAVPFPGDTAAAMAATYLIEDSLAAGPPGEDAVSLFFLASHDPSRGYVTRWSELRRYGDPSRKEAFAYLDWVRMPNGRLHLLRMYDESSVRVAADFLPADAEAEAEQKVEWREEERCPALSRLSGR